METQICFECTGELPNRAIYCPNCAVQVRCKSCHEVLEQNARACVICGALVGEGGEAKMANGVPKANLAANTIEFRETHKSRSLRATFTDEVGKDLNKTVNLLLSNRIGVARDWQQSPEETRPNDQKHLPAFADILETQDEQNESTIEGKAHAPVPNKANADKLKETFRVESDGSQLTLIDPRLKANSKIDFARRLTILFLYAHKNLRKRTQIPRSEVNHILRQASVYYGEIRRWIPKTPELIVDNDTLELSVAGRERAIEILNEVSDPNVPNSWEIGTTARKRGSNRGGAKTKTDQDTKSDASNKTGQKSKTSLSSRKPSPTELINHLLEQGFFEKRRVLNDIISHCSSHLAYHYKSNQLSPILPRFVRDKKLKREKNKDGQFEYFA